MSYRAQSNNEMDCDNIFTPPTDVKQDVLLRLGCATRLELINRLRQIREENDNGDLTPMLIKQYELTKTEVQTIKHEILCASVVPKVWEVAMPLVAMRGNLGIFNYILKLLPDVQYALCTSLAENKISYQSFVKQCNTTAKEGKETSTLRQDFISSNEDVTLKRRPDFENVAALEEAVVTQLRPRPRMMEAGRDELSDDEREYHSKLVPVIRCLKREGHMVETQPYDSEYTSSLPQRDLYYSYSGYYPPYSSYPPYSYSQSHAPSYSNSYHHNSGFSYVNSTNDLNAYSLSNYSNRQNSYSQAYLDSYHYSNTSPTQASANPNKRRRCEEVPFTSRNAIVVAHTHTHNL